MILLYYLEQILLEFSRGISLFGGKKGIYNEVFLHHVVQRT